MRILNPYFIQEASFKLIGLPHYNGQMGRGVRDPPCARRELTAGAGAVGGACVSACIREGLSEGRADAAGAPDRAGRGATH